MLEPTFALQFQPYILIGDTCRIILVPNTMLLAILKFNYNVNYVKHKMHNSILRGKIDVRLTLLCFWKRKVDSGNDLKKKLFWQVQHLIIKSNQDLS